ncbi:MAG TPA: hypothetical protein VJN67_19560 [Stellaceae bacterium]|nr:hypothetical protein [Stellaceae bacterium]
MPGAVDPLDAGALGPHLRLRLEASECQHDYGLGEGGPCFDGLGAARRLWQPATVGIYSFLGAEYADWHRVMAFASIFVLPILALFIALQNRIVAALTAGALK